jgi:hypothetical protein
MGVMTDERDEVIRALTRHCGDGRLTLDELEQRIEEAYAATTDAELRHVLRELPADRTEVPAEPEPVERATWTAPIPALPRIPERSMPPSFPKPPSLPSRVEPPQWEKSVGTLFCIGGFVLLFNGMFWLAMLCWFVLPGLVLHSRRG